MLSFHPDGILFDCDSTLSHVEGIDELARLKNQHEQIAALTDAAMNGEVPLEAVYTKRLDLIRPSRTDLAHIAQHYLDTLTPGALTLINTIKAKNIPVGIVSGGLREAIQPLAKHLGIGQDDLYAVDLSFDSEGHYQAVQPSPLTTANGKYTIAEQWKNKHHCQHVVLIGDGMSDMAALGACEAVIGYGGIIRRETVVPHATFYYDERNLEGLLPLLNLR